MLGVMLWLCSGGFLQGSKAAAWDFALRGSTPGCVLFAETRLSGGYISRDIAIPACSLAPDGRIVEASNFLHITLSTVDLTFFDHLKWSSA